MGDAVKAAREWKSAEYHVKMACCSSGLQVGRGMSASATYSTVLLRCLLGVPTLVSVGHRRTLAAELRVELLEQRAREEHAARRAVRGNIALKEKRAVVGDHGVPADRRQPGKGARLVCSDRLGTRLTNAGNLGTNEGR